MQFIDIHLEARMDVRFGVDVVFLVEGRRYGMVFVDRQVLQHGRPGGCCLGGCCGHHPVTALRGGGGGGGREWAWWSRCVPRASWRSRSGLEVDRVGAGCATGVLLAGVSLLGVPVLDDVGRVASFKRCFAFWARLTLLRFGMML